ncbi:hypothetical protein TWF730_006721 [Orbilia blumenaviensis]|uniref:3CxxC-type domain-containing protein n=1 Tax=Orbilia blumenaviensis TaxID=1796055 RepID=A0AAV9VF34_9PEZI
MTGARMSNSKESIQEMLEAMDRMQLNSLDARDYPPDQRRLINEERVRRKKAEASVTYTDPQPPSRNESEEAADPKHIQEIKAPPEGRKTNGPRPSKVKGSPKAGNQGWPSEEKEKEPEPWYSVEEYHNKICDKVKNVVFVPTVRSGSRKSETNLVANFICTTGTPECKQVGWSSGMVVTHIRGYYRGSDLCYNVQVYNQRCPRCERMGRMTLDVNVYVERIVRRLKIWKGEFKPTPGIQKKIWHKTRGRCEGCKGKGKGGCCLRGVVRGNPESGFMLTYIPK